MVGMTGDEPIIGSQDPRQLVARLAAAVMIADGRITESEMAAVERLEDLGLGSLTSLVQAEIKRAMRQPIDLAATIADLGAVAPESAALVVSGLAQIATSDRELSQREVDVLTAIAGGLGLSEMETVHLIRAAAEGTGAGAAAGAPGGPRIHIVGEKPPAGPAPVSAPPPGPQRSGGPRDLDWALHLLGLTPSDSIEQAEAAYAALVRRYNPAAVLELGPEFAVMAVQKLSTATAAYVAVREALR